MEGIEHRTVEVNGINMHVTEKGKGPVVLFLHGFPELWYTWRHQIQYISSQGYRAVAPDLRGYGDTEAPPSVTSYTIKAYVCLSVPFLKRRNPKVKKVDGFRAAYGDDYYICRFQKPGEIEAQMAEVGTAYVLKNILTTRKPGPPILPKGEYGTGFNPDMTDTLPSWLTEDELAYFVAKFEKTGFSGALNYYRNFNTNWELSAPWDGVQIKVPVKFITGELDIVYTSPGMKDYVHGGGFKQDVPNLEEVIVQKGVAHFNNQEAAEEISNHIYDFIRKF
ncbi:hypothetical protein RIF29_24536 [Crotalaria pallida]|uniref:AB hydrolase-1 domain-containing protein n=1 Tax=Crotalaria pallida TaxID=3830 RepID=A0AAN9EK00_CROPI